ncbi:TatD family hydrolase [Paenibacillus sp. GCM10027627]|uniref:TatD family hydrolase n=1 Tax=unclassified Paenibacillus TaxID=185978 RepID=UPI003625FC75
MGVNNEGAENRRDPVARRYIDAHIHIDLYAEAEQTVLLEEAFRNGVEAVVAVSMQLESCKRNAVLAGLYPGRVHPAYGFHPEQTLPEEREVERLLSWIRQRHAAGDAFAIGEVGLPYYMRTDKEAAGHYFDEAPYLCLLDRFAQLAAELDRPIVLHAVYEDGDKACDLLERHGVRKAHFHWFKGAEATVERMMKAGYRISVTPDVAYEPEIAALVQKYPIELLMAETDGPWPFEGPFAGMATKPLMVREVAKSISRIKGLPLKETEAMLLQNTKSFYGIGK